MDAETAPILRGRKKARRSPLMFALPRRSGDPRPAPEALPLLAPLRRAGDPQPARGLPIGYRSL